MDTPQHLNVALFVRAAAGFAQPGDAWSSLPPWPPEFVDRGIVDAEVEPARTEWSSWWRSLCGLPPPPSVEGLEEWIGQRAAAFDPPEFESLAQMNHLQPACRRLWPAAHQWWAAPAGAKAALTNRASGPGLVGEEMAKIVRRFERTKHRRAKPFTLQLDLVYVDTDQIELLAEDHALLGARWLRQSERLLPWLEERVASIA